MPDASQGLLAWVEAHAARAPAALRERVLARAAEAPQAEEGTLPARLARAAEGVLALVERHPGDRSIALDLLAADALITLALLAQAETAPDRLGSFAAELLQGERG
ncbi:MAG TPA: hypothetical protein VNK43_04795 [Gemmatimonadales bacterium]|nr:hypothetical protein [Gemmatimonadales bacterium]